VYERLTQITLVDKELHELLPGEVTHSERHRTWFIGCPSNNCGVGSLAGHTVDYDDVEKSITVSPSILCSCGAHYFVERNKIRWV